MSPEQAEGKSVDARTDIYALGLMMYELIVGREQFEALMKLQPNWNNSLGGWLLWHCSEELRLPRLETLRPDLPVLLCTGLIRDEVPAEMLRAGAAGLLRKTFRMTELWYAVKQALTH